MKWERVLFAGFTLFALVGCVTLKSIPVSSEKVIISTYTQAYNDRDVQAMAALMHPDIQWFSIDGQEIEVVANGKADLVEQMTDYVSSPSATSSILEGEVADGPFLAVRELARWSRKDGSVAEQSALAVYEIRDGLVRRVWYYPATP